MLVCAALDKPIDTEGERVSVKHTDQHPKRFCSSLPGGGLPAFCSGCVLEMDYSEGSIVTRITLICYSLGGSLEFPGWAWAGTEGITTKLKWLQNQIS